MRYALERMRRENIEKSYRYYITDALYELPRNNAMGIRWRELFTPKPEIDADKIINSLADALGGEE